MGLDVIRFRGGVVDEELICPICTGVLEAPLQAPVIESSTTIIIDSEKT